MMTNLVTEMKYQVTLEFRLIEYCLDFNTKYENIISAIQKQPGCLDFSFTYDDVIEAIQKSMGDL